MQINVTITAEATKEMTRWAGTLAGFDTGANGPQSDPATAKIIHAMLAAGTAGALQEVKVGLLDAIDRLPAHRQEEVQAALDERSAELAGASET